MHILVPAASELTYHCQPLNCPEEIGGRGGDLDRALLSPGHMKRIVLANISTYLIQSREKCKLCKYIAAKFSGPVLIVYVLALIFGVLFEFNAF